MTPSCPPPWRVRRKYAPRKRPDLGCDRDEVAKGAEPGERLALELADALPRQVELVPDRLERPRLALEAEPKLEDPPLPLRERVERAPHALPAERLLGLVERVGGLAVGEEGLERVGGAGELGGLDGRLLDLLLGLGRGRLSDLEPDALELAGDLLDLDLGEVVLDREGLEVRGLDEAALLGALDERARLIGVEQLVQLVRRQLVPNPLYVRRRRSLKLSDCRPRFLVFPGGTTLSG